MVDTVKIFALGGLDENGKSLYCVSVNEQLYVFDAGLRYPEEGLLGVDVILPSFQYLIAHKDCIKGFFLTHGHDENIGALPFILEQLESAEIYGTNYTLMALLNCASRLKKKISHVNLHTIDENADFVVNGTNIHSFSLTHSVPESCGFALETNYGQIIYTGDFILDFSAKTPYETKLTRLLEIASRPTLALLAESYNATHQGFVAPNHHMANRLQSLLEEVKGRIFISLYGQTIYQFEEIIKCAIKSKRKIFLYTSFAKDCVSFLKKNVKQFSLPDNIITNNPFERDAIIVVTEMGNKVFENLSDIALANDTDKSFRITHDDAFVIASPAHTGTELAFARILDKLYRTDAQIYNITKDFTSMHAGSEDLKTLLTIFKPKYYFPVRGYYNKMLENAKLAVDLDYNHNNVFVFDNGMILTIENGVASNNVTSLEAEEIMVDGIGIGDVGNVVINDRRKLQQDGVMIIACSFSMSGRKIVAGPDIQTKGFVIGNKSAIFTERLSKYFASIVYDYIQKPGLVDFNDLRAICKEKIQAFCKEEIDKDPMILPVIISV